MNQLEIHAGNEWRNLQSLIDRIDVPEKVRDEIRESVDAMLEARIAAIENPITEEPILEEISSDQDAIRQAVEVGGWIKNDLGLVRGTSTQRVASSWTIEFFGDGYGRSVIIWASVQDGEMKAGNFYLAEILQDITFWEALGRARGWKPTLTVFKKDPWFNYARSYFETLLSNGDMKEFWRSLP